MNSAASMKPITKSSPQTDSCSWESPGAPVRIHMKAEVIDRLASEVLRDPARPADREAGGVLLGKSYLRRKPTIEIHDFEPFAVERRQGSAYVFSAADKKKLEKLISDRNKTELAVVGLYRTHMRQGLTMEGEDLSLFRTHFPDPSSVGLLIEKENTGAPLGSFFFWQDSQLQSIPEFREFPFDSKRLAERPETTAVPVAPIATNVPLPPAAPSQPARKKNLRLSLAAALLLAVSGGGYFGLLRSSSGLGLRARRTNDGFEVTWNRSAGAFANAREALFSIRDGDFQKEIYLDLGQLRTGAVLYPVNSSNEVRFRLDVFSVRGTDITETVLVTGASGGSRPATTQEAVSQNAPPAPATVVGGTPLQSSAARAESSLADEPIQNEVTTDAGAVILSSEPAAPRPVFKLPETPAESTRTELIEPPPETLPAAGALPQISGEIRPPTPPLAKLEAPPPPPAAEEPKVAAQVAEPQPEPEANFTPPRALRQVQPIVPRTLKGMVGTGTYVDIRVSIDAAGRVISATPMASKGQVSNYLGALAAGSAKLWKFEPAKKGGQNVASETTLRFKF